MEKLNLMTDGQVRNCLIQILQYVDEWCARNNVVYYLYFGTLIGAVRHKGFIPWDDDVDIAMPREDYNRFIKEFNDSSERYKVVDISINDRYYLPFAKVIDNKTVLQEQVKHAIDLGVYIDIFPIDSLGNDINIATSHLKRMWFYIDVLSAKLLPWHRRRSIKRNVLSLLASFYPKSTKSVVKQIESLAKEFNAIESPRYMGNIVAKSYKKGLMPSEWFDGISKTEFEGFKFNIPIHYNNILTQLYGDYMKLPPEEKRTPMHDYDAYWINYKEGQ